MTDDRFYYQLIKGCLLFIAGLFFLRLFPALWGALGVGVVLLFIVSSVYALYRSRQRRQQKAARQATFSGSIQLRINQAKARADHFRNEAATIMQSYQELAETLAGTVSPNQEAVAKSERLLRELHGQQALRLSKASFFEDSVVQLEKLLQQHKLYETLLAKEAELDRLREANHDDTAEMESVRYQLEQDKIRLETITELTHRAALSPNLDQTELLRMELDKLAG